MLWILLPDNLKYVQSKWVGIKFKERFLNKNIFNCFMINKRCLVAIFVAIYSFDKNDEINAQKSHLLAHHRSIFTHSEAVSYII